MPNAVRVLLDEGSDGSDLQDDVAVAPRLVSSVRVRQRTLEAGLTQAPLDEVQPAKLEFFARSLESARNQVTDAPISIGVIDGQVLREGRPLRVSSQRRGKKH